MSTSSGSATLRRQQANEDPKDVIARVDLMMAQVVARPQQHLHLPFFDCSHLQRVLQSVQSLHLDISVLTGACCLSLLAWVYIFLCLEGFPRRLILKQRPLDTWRRVMCDWRMEPHHNAQDPKEVMARVNEMMSDTAAQDPAARMGEETVEMILARVANMQSTTLFRQEPAQATRERVLDAPAVAAGAAVAADAAVAEDEGRAVRDEEEAERRRAAAIESDAKAKLEAEAAAEAVLQRLKEEAEVSARAAQATQAKVTARRVCLRLRSCSRKKVLAHRVEGAGGSPGLTFSTLSPFSFCPVLTAALLLCGSRQGRRWRPLESLR